MNTQPEALRLADAIHLGWLENVDSDKADIDMIQTELRRLDAIEQAAKNLVKVKGRYHTEQAFNKLKELVK